MDAITFAQMVQIELTIVQVTVASFILLACTLQLLIMYKSRR